MGTQLSLCEECQLCGNPVRCGERLIIESRVGTCHIVGAVCESCQHLAATRHFERHLDVGDCTYSRIDQRRTVLGSWECKKSVSSYAAACGHKEKKSD